jgi:hypothetical protein
MIEIRFDKTKDEVALLIWFLVDHTVLVECELFSISSSTSSCASSFNVAGRPVFGRFFTTPWSEICCQSY